jgi:cell division protein FtsQ
MTGAASGGAPASGSASGSAPGSASGSAPGGAAPGPGGATDVATPAAPPPGRRRRRRVPWRTRFFALAGVAAVALVAWVLLGNRVFVVRSVTVTGTHLVSPAQVIATADVPLGTPLSRVDAGAVTKRIETIRQVSSATVTLDWPDHVAIVVTERAPVMAVRMANGSYDLVDPSGVIVLSKMAKPAGLPLFTTPLSGAALRADPGVAAASAVLAELTPSLARTVSSVSVAQVPTGSGGGGFAESQQVTLSVKGGKTIVWGDPTNAAAKNRELEILLRNGVNYVNVSAPGTVVTR